MGKRIITVNPPDIVDKNLSPIPQEVEIKEEFVERYKMLMGKEYDSFLQHSLSYARKSIRANTLKISADVLQARLEKDWLLEEVPWCRDGFFISYRDGDRFDLGNLPEHQIGYFYVQDAASMIPPLVLAPAQGDIVLDLCSAPGSKTTQIAALMGNTGVVFANDASSARLKPLGLNLQRCGVMNTIVTLRANNRFKPIFDKVLVDAPCSATGTIRRSLKALQMWSPGYVRRIVNEQRGILGQGWRALRPGGILVYSTCTLEPEEDEGLISWFLQQHPEAELLDITLAGIRRSPAVTSFEGQEYNPEVRKCLRIGPHDNDTEGFFVAKIQKRE